MASLCLPPGTNWCPSRVDVSAPGANASSVAVTVRALILASTTTLTPIQLPPPLLTRGRPTERGDGTCILRPPSSLSLKLTSSSFKLGAGNDLGVATPMLLLLYAWCLAARRTRTDLLTASAVIVQVWIITGGGCDTFTKWPREGEVEDLR